MRTFRYLLFTFLSWLIVSLSVYANEVINLAVGESRDIFMPSGYIVGDMSYTTDWTSSSSAVKIIYRTKDKCTILAGSPATNVTITMKTTYVRSNGWFVDDGTFTEKWTVNVTANPKVKLSASHTGGNVTAGTKVYLSATPSDASIYYSLNGNAPTTSSTLYTSSGVIIDDECTLQAIAVKDGYETSDILRINFYVKTPKLSVKILPEYSSVYKTQHIYINAFSGPWTTSRASIYYTTDGTTPSKTKGTLYTDPFTIDRETTIKAIAYGDGYITSDVCTQTYTIKYQKNEKMTSSTPEGVELLYYVTDTEEMTCRIGRQDKSIAGKVTIPESVNGYRVTSVVDDAFYNCKMLTSIAFPSTIKEIGEQAFVGCSALEAITGMDNVEIIHEDSKGVFYDTPWYKNLDDGVVYVGHVLYRYKGEVPANTILRIQEGCTQILTSFYKQSGLTELYIPGSVVSMPELLTDQCPNLQKITVDASNTVYDSRNNCNAIIKTATNTLVQGCSGTTIPMTVTSIGAKAFRGIWTKDEIVIPNNIDSIGDIAFVNCSNVRRILIGKGLRKIGVNAFALLPNLKEIAVSADNPYLDSRDNCNAIIERATNTLLVGCSTTTIHHTVKTIGVQPFYGNGDENFTSLVIPNSVEEIQIGAFGALPHLREVSIGANVKKFGNSIFWQCNNLEAIESLNCFPDDIDEEVFNSGSGDFSIYDNVTLYVPVGSLNKYRLAAGWSNFKKIVEGIPEDSKTTGDVNKDGIVNGSDLVVLVNQILGKTDNTSAADLNGDGRVDGTDYVQLVNKILNKN